MQNNVLNYLYDAVKRTPDKVAYADDDVAYTFKQTDDESAAIASYLASKGIVKKPVVVFMKKSPKEVITFFGIIRAGSYYVPIDEEMPKGRIQLILDNVKSPLVICDESTLEIARTFNLYDGEVVLQSDINTTAKDEKALLDIYHKAIDTDPIYIVFTSGSTGIPKGVVACHRSVVEYVEQLSETLKFNENTVFGNQSPLYFDACLKELYPTLKFSATTYLIPRSAFSIPTVLVKYLNDHKINTICWVVSALTMISAFGTFDEIKPEYLTTVAFGSEVFPIKQYKLWKEALPNASFTNLYGPTEATGMTCFFHVDREFEEGEVIPIGKPFSNREVLLLTDDNKLAAPGEQGEICIRGTSLTLGYYNDPQRTADAFVQNPLNTFYPELIYRTGDIGRLNDRGELCFVSRKDYQIKHMGHRIELGEIEVDVAMIEGVKMTACVYDDTKGKIVLFYVGDLTEKDLIIAMKAALPRYMLPNKTVKLDALPLTANGKIDRVTLKKSI